MRKILVLITIISSIVMYLPYLGSIDTVYRYLDGPLYVVVAKNFYSIAENPFLLPDYYFAAHLVGYPLMIRIFSFLGYFPSMLFVTLLFSTLSILVFYKVLKDFGYAKDPFFIALLFIFLPPKWLVYHSMGAPEPMFVFLVLSSFYLFKKERFLASAALAAVATITKIHGIALFPAYLLLTYKRKESLYYLLIPAFLALHFYWYSLSFGDFFAYFKWNVGLKTLNYPFHSILTYGEGHLMLYLVYGIAIALLWKRDKALAVMATFLYLPLIFVIHQDLSRYFIPVSPFALIAFQNLFNDRIVRIIIIGSLIPIYFYAWSTIPTNLTPVEAYLTVRNM